MYVSEANLPVNAVCPYYQSEFRRMITCEWVAEGSTISSKFEDEQSKMEYAKCHCCKYPNECYIAMALDKKYT